MPKELVAPGEPLPSPISEERRAVSISDLIHRCNDAAGKMSAENPNKILLLNCASAFKQLVDRLEAFENPPGRLQ